MNDGIHWQIYAGIAALLILLLVLFWPDSSDRVQQGEASPGTLSQPLPASETAPIRKSDPINPFSSKRSSNSFTAPSPTEPSVKTDALHQQPPVLNQQDKATDWGQWRKADERQRSYLGGPPGPGKPSE